MTVKSERRRYYRAYRKLGIPFIPAQKLASLRSKGRFSYYDLERTLGVPIEVINNCECCGPIGYSFSFKGKTFEVGLGLSIL